MDRLLTPDFGVFALTVVNFLLLVWLLHKFAWKGIIGTLEHRENQIASDKAAAAQARADSEKIKAELDEKLRHIANEAAKKMQEAVALGNAQKEQLLAQTQEQAQRLLAQAKEQIEAEKNQALKEVRAQVAQAAVLAATKITHRQLDEKSAAQTVEEVLHDLQKRA